VTAKRRQANRQVDHRYLAELCARHQSGDYVLAAERFCAAKKLPVLDALRIKRLAAQQAAIEAAIAQAKKDT
jgi:hypothetical protein